MNILKNQRIGKYVKTHPLGDMYDNETFQQILEQDDVNSNFQKTLRSVIDITMTMKDGSYHFEEEEITKVVGNPNVKEFDWEEIKGRGVRNRFS